MQMQEGHADKFLIIKKVNTKFYRCYFTNLALFAKYKLEKKGTMSHLSNAFSKAIICGELIIFRFDISKLKMQQSSIVGMITQKKCWRSCFQYCCYKSFFLLMCVVFLETSKISLIVGKFIYCEKATKIWKIFNLVLKLLSKLWKI